MNKPQWGNSRVRFWSRSLAVSEHDEITKHIGLTLAAFCDQSGVRGQFSLPNLREHLPYGDPDIAAALTALVSSGWLCLRQCQTQGGETFTRYSLRADAAALPTAARA